jgi:hypothetical protein
MSFFYKETGARSPFLQINPKNTKSSINVQPLVRTPSYDKSTGIEALSSRDETPSSIQTQKTHRFVAL